MLINLATLQVYTKSEFRAAFPNTSFPATINYEDFGYAVVFPTPQPEHNAITHVAREITPVLTSKGHYEQQWEVVQKFDNPDDEAAAIAADNQAKVDRITNEIITATQKRLDDFAKTRNYDGILSACTYATSTVAKFQSEGQYCVDARDATWSKLYAIMGEVEARTRPMPASYADIESELPVLSWPQ